MASNKNTEGTRKRSYTLRARARRREEVHHRITLAAVHLHGTVGPARTTVSEIAKRAGVRRATVYNHFPSDLELLDACSSHWFGEHPPPDPGRWAEIPDPRDRVEAALVAMYEYYDSGRDMLENVLRDAPLVGALEETIRRKWVPVMERIVETLAGGWNPHGQERRATRDSHSSGAQNAGMTQPAPQADDVELRASLRVALDFFTWRTLTASGLSNENAARLAVAWIVAGRTPR